MIGVSANSRITKETADPTTLNRKWIIAARFASLFPPRLAISAETQEPILQPSTKNGQIVNARSPCDAIKITIPTVADELCRIAVITKPTIIAANGFLSDFNNSTICGDSLIVVIASPIILSPKNRIPNPRITSPAFFTFTFLQNITITTPMITNKGAISDKLNAIN